jgi:magnesium chelatase family protein
MLAKLFGSALYGIDAFRITIEVSVSNGLGYHITGLPDEAISESLSRIEVALKSSGFQMPRTKLIINLAPADIRKAGTALDLPIALGILLASNQLNDRGKLKNYIIVGEIGLDGALYPVRGALCMAHQARKDGFKGILLPVENATEAALVDELNVYGFTSLQQVVAFLKKEDTIKETRRNPQTVPSAREDEFDFKHVRGQKGVKRALEIAAAGGHNALLIGPPGIGKTLLAKCLPSIMPPMSDPESLETTRIYSLIKKNEPLTGLIRARPFRSPHHTCSDIALAGGGSFPMPGEISLAHNGILFLDELPEFKRSAIEVLRQPLEDRKVLIARAKLSLEYPSTFLLLAAMNPCLCGYFGHPKRICTCSRRAVNSYRHRISGPILERIDLQVMVDPVPCSEMLGENPAVESSATIRARVLKTREIQARRFSGKAPIYCNAQMQDKDIEGYCPLEESARKYLLRTMDLAQLSPRSYTRTIKLARTIADMAAKEIIELDHIAEALHFRSLDKPLVIPTTKKNKSHVHDSV